MLVMPKGAGTTKLLSNMKLKHRLQNSILLKLLVLQIVPLLAAIFGAAAITPAMYQQRRRQHKVRKLRKGQAPQIQKRGMHTSKRCPVFKYS